VTPIPTVRLASLVYADAPEPDDPAETYHEASKVAPATAARELAGAGRLEAIEELRASAARSVRRHPIRRRRRLPAATPLARPLDEALASRRTVREFSEQAIDFEALAAILGAAYGVTGSLGRGDGVQRLRAAPSAGALYPLELHVLARHVRDLPSALFHYDPLRASLEECAATPDLAEATPYVQLVSSAAATVVVSACFWRSRFKYGLRAYRFTLLEAGHVVQNLLLAAASLGLGAAPVGGFYDRRLDEMLGLDGVDESSLYLACIGQCAG
jgi:SagB-type dehydrogenase family enzyme